MSREPKNIPASVQGRLKNIAIQEKKSFDLILLLYLQERFLYRLSISTFADKFILKGGLLLFSMTNFQTRPTKDIDFLARQISNNMEQLKDAFQQVSQISIPEDGVIFDEQSVTAERITEYADYEGVRIKLRASLGTMKKQLQFDIGFGDVIVPKPRIIDYPVLLDMAVPSLQAYSVESVIAEKFEAMITLSVANSRMKDFYDIYILLNRHNFDGRVLQESVYETFSRRGTIIERNHSLFTNAFAQDQSRASQWQAFLSRTGLESIPFETVMDQIRTFLRPIYETILKEDEFFKEWICSDKEWQ
jgi:predicted nucleotidyltransferase component of viral defense system